MYGLSLILYDSPGRAWRSHDKSRVDCDVWGTRASAVLTDSWKALVNIMQPREREREERRLTFPL